MSDKQKQTWEDRFPAVELPPKPDLSVFPPTKEQYAYKDAVLALQKHMIAVALDIMEPTIADQTASVTDVLAFYVAAQYLNTDGFSGNPFAPFGSLFQ